MKLPYWIFTLFLFLTFASTNFNMLQASDLPDGFVEEQIATGLDPTTMALAPDGRIFIAEKNGRVLVVRDGELLPDPFLVLTLDNSNERGLSGIAFDPNFEENQYVYVYYTTLTGATHNRVSRFTANGDLAVPGSEQVILEIDPLSGSIHNAGAMEFGSDGKLYIATGEGAKPANSQDMNKLLGKIIRINSDGSIPEDNPFYDELEGKYRAIWASGFRNPFSMAIEHSTGRVFSCDVGSHLFEEVNAVEKGKNYGWSILEGPRTDEEVPENYADPLYAYNRSLGCSVIGAAFYSPDNKTFPEEYHDKFFFGDYCKGYIKVMNPQTGEIERTFVTGVDRPLNFLVTPEGDFYYLERAGLGGGSEADNTASSNGKLWKISYTGNGAPFVSVQPRSILLPVGETATFSVQAGGLKPLVYQWQRNGVDIEGANESIYHLENIAVADDGSVFHCKVSNEAGEILSEEAILTVTSNTRPTPVIIAPETNLTYQGGDILTFEGMAMDAEDGELALENLTWKIDFHHDEHSHPAMESTSGIAAGEYLTAKVGETAVNVWYRIYLTATDSEGLSKTTFTDVFPETVNITLESEPSGLWVNLDGRIVDLPHTFNSVVGIERNISAPISQELDVDLYAFREWQGGNADRLNTFFAPAKDSTLTVFYEHVPYGNGDGLVGDYYNGILGTVELQPIFTRIDTVIDFDWDEDSPDNELISHDDFSIVWRGGIQPLFSEVHTFHIISDDGIRLYVDDKPVIDHWILQAPTETSGDIYLEAGKKYSIRLEYFEDFGGAMIQMYWSSPHLSKRLLPMSQLFADLTIDIDDPESSPFLFKWFPNPTKDALTLRMKARKSENVRITWYDVTGREMVSEEMMVLPQTTEVTWSVSSFPKGIYVVEVKGDQLVESRVKVVVD